MNSQTSQSLLRTVLIITILVFGVSCTQEQDSASQEEKESIRVGAVLPLTGPVSFLGQSEQQGMTIAARSVQDRQVEIMFEDSNPQGDQGVAAAENLLTSQGVDFIYTSTTGVSNTIKKSVVEGRNTLQFVFAMDEGIPQDSDKVFRIYPGLQGEGEALLRYVRMVEPKSVTIVHFNNAAFTRLAEDILRPGLKGMKIESVTTEGFGEASELRSVSAKVKSSNPDLVLIGAYYNQIPQIIKSLKEYNLDQSAAIASTLDVTMSVGQDQIDPSLLQSIAVAVPAYSVYSEQPDSLSESVKAFVESYRAEYGERPNFDAAYAYDAVMMLVQAVSKAGTTEPSAVRKALYGMTYQGASGKLTIDSEGNVNTSWRLGMYCGGSLVGIRKIGQRAGRNAPVTCDAVAVAAGAP